MSISHLLARGLSAAAFACSILVAAAPAQAAVIGSFDPAFGATDSDPALANVGFRGTFSLDVSSGCYNPGGGYEINGGSDGCQITMTSLEVDFYNTNNPGPTLTSVNVMNYIDPTQYVYGAWFDPETDLFTAFDSFDSGVFPVTVTDTTESNPADQVSYTGSMDLYFVSGYECDDGCIDPAYLFDFNSYAQSNGATVTVTTVPEPATIPLTLFGLAALAAVRRRAGQASAGRRLAH
jgi:hypothetical protein